MKETMKAHYDNLKAVKARDIMSRFAITARDDMAISELAHLMMRFKISGVPVLSEDGKICGIITATDLFNYIKKIVQAENQKENVGDYYAMKISSIMSRHVISIRPESSLHEIMLIMIEKDIHTLPVTAEGSNEIVGIIGRRDILNACYAGTKHGPVLN